MIDPGIKNKVTLITGANHGIGAATARAFATQGAKVFITYYYDSCSYSEEELQNARETGIGGDKLCRALQQQSVEPLVQAIRDQGGDVVAHEAALGDPDNIPKLFVVWHGAPY